MDLSTFNGNPVFIYNATPWVLFTPPTSQGFGTLGTSQLYIREDGEDILIEGRFAPGTPTPTQARIGLPGYVIGPQRGTGISLDFGEWDQENATASSIKTGSVIGAAGDSFITFSSKEQAGAINPLAPQNGSTIFTSAAIYLRVRIPAASLVGKGYVAVGAGIFPDRPSLTPGYEEYDHVTNFSGPFAAASRTVRIVKVGKLVTLTFPETRINPGNNTLSTISMATPIPARFRPRSDFYMPIYITDNNVDQNAVGYVVFTTAGAVGVGKLFTTPSFSATTGAVGFYGFTVSYYAL